MIRAYLPLEYCIRPYLNQRYYWDSSNQQILYATPSELQYVSGISESGDGDVWLKDGSVLFESCLCTRNIQIMDAYMG
ncbi:MAG: hypothetical protein ACLTX6_01080 [Lachnospiraceae bacterium]